MSGCDSSRSRAYASVLPTTSGTSTSFGLQFARFVGARPEKNSSDAAVRQLPLSASSFPSRHTTCSDVPYIDGGDLKNCTSRPPGTAGELSAFSMNVFQIRAGNVPPATASPWYCVVIGISLFG